MPLSSIEEIRENGIYVLFNPRAGSNSEHIKKSIKRELGTHHVNYYETTSRQDLRQMISWLAAEAKRKQTNFLVLPVGGDGTYHDTINTDESLDGLILGFTDGGSSGDYLRTLGIKKHVRMCELITALRDKKIPLEERVKLADMMKISYGLGDEQKSVNALNIFSLGFDGEVCKKVNCSVLQGGIKKKLGFIPAALQVLKDYVPLQVQYRINGELQENIAENVLSLITIIGQYAAGGMKYNPRGKVDDGLAECLIAQYSSKDKVKRDIIRLAFHIKLLRDNKVVDSLPLGDGYNQFGIRYSDNIKSAELRIINPDSGKESYFETDGEHYQFNPAKPLHLEVMPKALRVLYLPAS